MPRLRWLLSLMALALATLLLAACGSGAAEESRPTLASPEPTAVPTATPEPSPTPSPTPTATPTPTPWTIEPALTKKLPSGWSPEVELAESPGPTDAAPVGGTEPEVDRSGSRWKYRGVLGKLKPGDQVVEPGPAPPAHVAGTQPLTGLEGEFPADQPTVIVKMDNVRAARPQSGLSQADIVYEELVEEGITRFAAVFHSTGVENLGPVRSGRSTDIGIIDSYSVPVFGFSGANSVFGRLIDKQPIVNRGAEDYLGYWRVSGRAAPHNLFTSTNKLLEGLEGGEAPRPHFAYRAAGAALHPTAQPASTVRLQYLAKKSPYVEYNWDADAGGWLRWQSGTAHMDASGVQVGPPNMVVQFVNYVDAGLTDKHGEDLYEGVSVGTGPALVFTDGHVIEATWTRPSLDSVATFTDADGNHIELTPGQTFVSLVPPGGVTWG